MWSKSGHDWKCCHISEKNYFYSSRSAVPKECAEATCSVEESNQGRREALQFSLLQKLNEVHHGYEVNNSNQARHASLMARCDASP